MARFWVVTKEYNAYDQYGEYFVAIFKEKPTVSQLQGVISDPEIDMEHLVKIGGRKDVEEVWYNLHFIQEGVGYG